MSSSSYPNLNIPPSSNTVTVRVIDTTCEMVLPVGNILQPSIKGHTQFVCPSYSFLIEHGHFDRKVLFDLGVQKDWKNMAPVTVSMIEEYGWQVRVEKDVAQILDEGGIDKRSVEAIIWSHHHWDHLGDPSTFPSSTAVIVGPGFKEEICPNGKPHPNSSVKEEYHHERELREISDKDFTMNIAGFGAHDYFDDGSLYLLDAPGHTVGHLCALARTTPSTYIFMGGDVAHHCGEFRPSSFVPLPESILPNPITGSALVPCPGALFTKVHSQHRNDRPFYHLGTWPDGSPAAEDLERAEESLRKLETYDAHAEKVFVILAHDPAMKGIIDFFPRSANEWFEKGWGEKTRWMFLGDFKEAVETLSF